MGEGGGKKVPVTYRLRGCKGEGGGQTKENRLVLHCQKIIMLKQIQKQLLLFSIQIKSIYIHKVGWHLAIAFGGRGVL